MSKLDKYVTLKSGGKFHFLNPKPEEVFFEDIAYHLSRINRFSNIPEPHYSVAEHSILMAQYFMLRGDTEKAKQALMHDVSEMVTGDFPAPIKHCIPDFEQIETDLDIFFMKFFKLPYPIHPEIKLIDKRICNAEMRDIIGHPYNTYPEIEPLDNVSFHKWGWRKAKEEFALHFAFLFKEFVF